MSSDWFILALPAAFLLALVTTRRFLEPGSRFHVLDRPNHRSLHRDPTPRSGGLAFLTAIALVGGALSLIVGQFPLPGWVVAGGVLLAVVGWADDLTSLSPAVRLAVQGLAALLVVAAGLVPATLALPGIGITLPWPVALPLTLGFVVWMTNLYNFMDGMDGLAGSMGVIGFSTLALLGLLAGDVPFALGNGVVAAAVAGFLVWNLPPARIFMGDAGSLVLGYLAAAMILWGDARGLFPLLAGLLLFSPFIVDATLTLIRRALRGERVWEAHREHLYQRRVRAGRRHGQVLRPAVLLMLLCAGMAVAYSRATPPLQWGLLVIWAALWSLVIHRVKRGT